MNDKSINALIEKIDSVIASIEHKIQSITSTISEKQREIERLEKELEDLRENRENEEIINRLRKVIHTKFPEIEERISFGSKGIGYGHKNGREIVRIFPESDCAKLGFEYGDKIIDKFSCYDINI